MFGMLGWLESMELLELEAGGGRLVEEELETAERRWEGGCCWSCGKRRAQMRSRNEDDDERGGAVAFSDDQDPEYGGREGMTEGSM